MRECKQTYEAEMRYKAVALAVLMACCSLSSSALTLGRARGAAWIGQPLDVSIQIQGDPGQTAAGLCVEADVFHADSRVESNRVQITVDSASQADAFNVRIASSIPVDEPVVSIYLRAGCSQKTARKYVLLADYVSEPPPATAPPRAVVEVTAPNSPNPVTTESSTVTGSAAATVGGGQVASPVTVVDKAQPKVPAAPAKVITPKPASPSATKAAPKAEQQSKAANAASGTKPKEVVAKKPAENGKSRLKLDPLENLAERIKGLETATATVALDDMTKDAQRMVQMQSDVKALLDQAAKNEVSLMAMRERLEKAESERVPMYVVYGLGALVFLSVGGMVYVWTRRHDARDWHAGPLHTDVAFTTPSHQPTSAPAAPALAPAPEQESHLAHNAGAAADSTLASVAQAQVNDVEEDSLDLNLAELDAIESSNAIVLADHPDFFSEELYDIRQRAVFFSQLGKVDEAIESLEAGIRSTGNSGALLYLDLLEIAAQHNLKSDYRLFKEEFQQRFNARVPEIDSFQENRTGLDSHPDLIQRISQEWSTASVLNTLEALILKDSDVADDSLFNLTAFSDLVTLHGMVMQRAQPA